MKTVSAIFENGVFRPTQPVDLPERCRVDLEYQVQPETGATNGASAQSNAESSAASKEFDSTVPKIQDVIADIMSNVPQEEWDSLPPDLTDNLDHYLYGTPRK